LNKILVTIVIRLVALMPLRLRVFCGKLLGWFLGRVLRIRRERISEHLNLAFPDISPAQTNRLADAVYGHLGLLAFELLCLPALGARKVMELCSVRGREHFETAFGRGKGVIVLTAHLGNWELGLMRTAMLGPSCHVLTREVKGEPGRTAVGILRQAQTKVIALPKIGVMRRILDLLHGGGVLGMVLDQNRTASEGVFVDFFGRPACTTPAAAVLAERFGAAVVPLCFHRDEDGMHHVAEFLPEIPWEAPHGNRQDNIQHNTQRYTSFIENAIRRHPEQWIWMHRRWRTQPPESEACDSAVSSLPICAD